MAHILVVDDEAQIRAMLKQTLEKEGHEVFTAANGVEALKLTQENTIDLVITDIIMPEKEGIETILELKRTFPTIQIIAISGGGRIDPMTHLKMAKNLGARYVFKKPVKRDELLSAVRDLLGA